MKQSPSKGGDEEDSRNTSQITVDPTNHMQQRKEVHAGAKPMLPWPVTSRAQASGRDSCSLPSQERGVTTRELQSAKKHGVATPQ